MKRLISFALVVLFCALAAHQADALAPTSPTNSVAPEAASARAGSPVPYVVDVQVFGVDAKPRDKAELGDSIQLTVTNLDVLRASTGQPRQPLVLFLGNMEITNCSPVPAYGEGKSNELRFVLERKAANKEAWNALQSHPFRARDRQVVASVGVARSGVPIGADKPVTLLAWEFNRSSVAVALSFAALFGVFLWKCNSATLLRDPGAPAAGGNAPFSLAKVQLAWWFWIVVFSYFFIWSLTGETDNLNAQTLILLGISGGTLLIARNMNGQASQQTSPSENFFKDIMDDGQGPSLHRLQIIVWSVGLGFVFLDSVIERLAMPEFSPTMLALMGLSGTTYLTFKKLEKTRLEGISVSIAAGTKKATVSAATLPGATEYAATARDQAGNAITQRANVLPIEITLPAVGAYTFKVSAYKDATVVGESEEKSATVT